MKKKLFSRKGFSLTEVLVAVLILALVAAGVAVGVSSSAKVYKKSMDTSDAQMLLSTLSEAVMDELRYAQDISDDGSDTPSYTSANFGSGACLQSNASGHITAISGGSSIIGTGAYNDMQAEITYPFDGSVFFVTVKVLNSANSTVASADFTVSPIN